MIELWRGNANAWECDEMGHMNVRFYLAKAMQAVAGLADEAGLAGAFGAGATATLIPSSIHIRFLAESRPGAPLFIEGGFTGSGAHSADVALRMAHAVSSRTAATLRLTLAHADPRSGAAFPWPARFQDRFAALHVDTPPEAVARGVDEGAGSTQVSLDRAEAFGLQAIGRGRIEADECDGFGRMRPEFLLGKVSDSVVHLRSAFPEEFDSHADGAAPIGGALLECRILPRRWPRAGDGFVIRSGLAAANENVRTVVHWALDPATGRPWWTMQGVAAAFDLEARRIHKATPATLKALQAAVTPDLRP